ncbi:MAG: Ig domain-containing protein [Candidatus Acidiferrales bacterium]
MKRWALVVGGLCLLLFVLGGCGGNSAGSEPTIKLTPNAPQDVDQGQSISFTASVSDDTANQGVVWKLTGPNCNGDSCGTFTNSTPAGVTYTAPSGLLTQITVTLTATARVNNTTTATTTINVVLPPTFTTLTLPNGTNGTLYDQSIVVTGGTIPLHFTVVSGTLPVGLALANAGIVQGTPSGTNTSNTFTVQVADSGSPPITATQVFTIGIGPPAPLGISTGHLAAGQVGSPYNAEVTPYGGIPPYTWSLVAGSGVLPLNLLLSSTSGQISGIPTLPGTSGFTVQVIDSALPPQKAEVTLSLTIAPPPPLAIITTSLPQGVTATGYGATLQTTGGLAPITWTITTGQLPSGLSLNAATGEITGSPVRLETSTFTVRATDSESPQQSVSATFSITITSTTASTQDEIQLDGPYVFFFEGFSTVGPTIIAGEFTASGTGTISGGTEDINYPEAQKTASGVPFTGTYTLDPNGRGSMILTITEGGATTTVTYLYSMNTDGTARFIESDATGLRGSGILKPQSTTAFATSSLTGSYAFGMAGFDASLKRAATVGSLTLDGSGTVSTGDLDANDAGTGSSHPGITGTYTMTADGRGTMRLFLGGQFYVDYVLWMASPTDCFLISSDTLRPTTPPAIPAPTFLTFGEALLQQPAGTSGAFDDSALNGTGVATGLGLDGTSASIFGGLLTGNGSGTLSFFYDQNDAGTINSTASAPVAGTYAIAADGRVSISNEGTLLGVAYLSTTNDGFFIGSDTAGSLGRLEPQTAPLTSFSNASVSGSYVISTGYMADTKVTNLEGTFAADGDGNISGPDTIAIVNPADSSTTVDTLTGTYSVGPNGRGTAAFTSPAGMPASFVIYVVSPSTVRLVSSDGNDTHPVIYSFDH